MNESDFFTYKRMALRQCFSYMNDPQFEALACVDGPLLVLAGAGSGKTTVIVNRIANMVLFGNTLQVQTPVPDEKQTARLIEYCKGEDMSFGELQSIIAHRPVQPWQILAITFTNKAAQELKNRLADTLGDMAQDIHASTFHSACVRILRTCIDRLGYNKGFTIYDSDDSLRLMKKCLKELDISEKNFNPKSVLSVISHAKDQMLSTEDYTNRNHHEYYKSTIARLYTLYQSKLQEAQAVDFDDLIYLTVRVFECHPDVLQKYQNRYRYLLVDEYQDTNYAQYRFVSLLSQCHHNLCVVGDDDQSIYRFRGATIENILGFEEEFPHCTTIRLEENYRSTQNILDAANAVISHNTMRKEKCLWTASGSGEKIHHVKLQGAREESDFVVDTIEDLVADGEHSYHDCAVLYRVNAMSNAVERSLIRRRIPYRVYGGMRFQDRKEIKDMIAYLCVIHNENDRIRFERIINCPKRGIGEATVNAIFQISTDLHISPLEVLRQAESFPVLARRLGVLKDFLTMIEELRTMNNTTSLELLYDRLLEVSGYKAMLDLDPNDGASRLENVMELRTNILEYLNEHTNGDLEGFLEENALYTDADHEEDRDTVSLMTIHAAKGLEFDSVFVVGMENGIFPRSIVTMQSGSYNEDLEEERRLCYVAITRAKRRIYLLNTARRTLFGRNEMVNPPSRFLREIPEELLEFDDRSVGLASQQAEFGMRTSISGVSYMNHAVEQQRKRMTMPDSHTPLAVFASGDRVKSRTFGEGTVVSYDPVGNDALMEIMFDTVGTKRVMARYQKITKLS